MVESNEIQIEYITPEESALSSVKTDFLCEEDGCLRKFQSLPVLRLHQSQGVRSLHSSHTPVATDYKIIDYKMKQSTQTLQFILEVHGHQRIQKNTTKNFNIEERFHCPIKDCIYYHSAYTLSRYFEKLKYLKQHYLKVHGASSFPCSSCNKSFAAKSFLRDHEKYCRLDLLCSCKQRFTSISSLQTHVRRTGHESEILQLILASRLKEKQSKKQAQTSKFSSNRGSCFSSGSILPKRQPHHLTAAIALSELASSGIGRYPSSVEVGTQTEVSSHRKPGKKSLTPSKHRSSQTYKRKYTNEIETQTHLTTSKSKIKKKQNKISKKSATTNTNWSSKKVPQSLSSVQTENFDSSTITPNMYSNDWRDNVPLHCASQNSCQTQTVNIYTLPSTSLSSFCDFNSIVDDQLNMNLEIKVLKSSGTKENVSDCVDLNLNKFSFDRYSESHSTLNTVNEVGESSQCEMYVSGNVINEDPIYSHIETQTDQDVFLNTHVDDADDPPDFGISAQTQTEWDKGVSGDSFWCTSETQTYEEFSDIEPFLCTVIHTRTTGTDPSSAELFPELSNFTCDMQTQTGAGEGLEEAKILMNTQT